MKKVYEYQGGGDPIFFSTLKKAYEMAKDDGYCDSFPSYRTVRKSIKEEGFWEMEVEWLCDYITITKIKLL